MTEESTTIVEEVAADVPDSIDADDPRRRLFERRAEWGLEGHWKRYVLSDASGEDEDDDDWDLSVTLPGGKAPISRWLSTERAEQLLRTEPTTVAAIEGLNAFRFGTDELEVALRSLSPMAVLQLRCLPWAERISQAVDPADDLDAEEVPLDDSIGRNEPWRIEIRDTPSPLEVRIGTASDRFKVFSRPPTSNLVTLTVRGFDVRRHDPAKAELEVLLGNLAFELDLKYNIAFSAQTTSDASGSRRPGSRGRRDASPTYPTQEYSREPLSLYWYGRSASNMPLLQYLAFYQVLEFHFPQFFQRELVTRLKTELKDPRFQANDDAQITRLLSLIGAGTGRRAAESDQLAATIRACVTSETLLDFVNTESTVKLAVTGKRVLDGVAQLNLDDKSHDLRDQVAKRVYAIRCRIVHTKDDEEAYGSRMLLPFSGEAARLGSDIALVRFLAQKVLIASSQYRR